MKSELIDECLKELLDIKKELKDYTQKMNIETPNKESDLSTTNMYQYLKFRSIDSRALQEKLVKLGLSSLGRSQPHILDSVNQVIIILSKLKNLGYDDIDNPLDYDRAYDIFQENLKIFGDDHKYHKDSFRTNIMVTLPSEAASDKKLIPSLYKSGAQTFRINTAHDKLTSWKKMAKIIDSIDAKEEQKPKIYVDLAGPKIRTSQTTRTKQAIKIGSKKDDAKVRLLSASNSQTDNLTSTIALDDTFIENCKEGSQIRFRDLNNKKIKLKVVKKDRSGLVCTINKKATVDENVMLRLKGENIYGNIKNLKETAEEIRVFQGDIIKISSSIKYGFITKDASEKSKANIGCTNKKAIKYVKVNDNVFIDDGKIELQVIDKIGDDTFCKVIRSKKNGTILKEEKGINFPDSHIELDALTTEDVRHVKSIVNFADIIGISFCQSKQDVERLMGLLEKYDKKDIAIVAKIETKKGVENLPQILEALIKHKNSAVMIARGDLAIEVGFENLSVMQEEILNLCEAAHMPIIYATQVLENMMKTNLPSRAEITDAAFAQRADCIMLNKGEYAQNTIKILKSILKSMHKIFKKDMQLLSPESLFKF